MAPAGGLIKYRSEAEVMEGIAGYYRSEYGSDADEFIQANPTIMNFLYSLKGKRVWVAGHRGMIGSALLRRLAKENCEILTIRRDQLDYHGVGWSWCGGGNRFFCLVVRSPRTAPGES